MTTNERPAEFDQKLEAHIDYIKNFIRKIAPQENLEEVTQDVMLYALEKWHLYRPDDGGFGTWLSWQVRTVVEGYRGKAKTRRKYFSEADVGELLPFRSTEPQQENIVMAAQMVRKLSRSRGGRMLVRLAAGERMYEIAARRKISHQRVEQLISKERKKIQKVA
ncbi:sigma-70 family RNA polymerase sigma factor [Mesorhizobium retamae]|uniref:Sigma-70 family RNA polymerase sigma factor n=1 Tax=Mesorhizobium retamae TaxID=2912854 RepID=A0ABS9QI50_9HYPH|nr:sigma-70 family RNA polymerase sigma factor [Mesorhizobium sp. IRAMC:0171]MCG7507085.1 sigma-70 family RNA polymerase sigma factor [Mesorhizobium sp. IRAMC:0171]